MIFRSLLFTNVGHVNVSILIIHVIFVVILIVPLSMIMIRVNMYMKNESISKTTSNHSITSFIAQKKK